MSCKGKSAKSNKLPIAIRIKKNEMKKTIFSLFLFVSVTVSGQNQAVEDTVAKPVIPLLANLMEQKQKSK